MKNWNASEKKKRLLEFYYPRITMAEKRKFVRFNANIEVEWEIPSSFHPVAQGVTSKTKDLSRGGICLRIDKRLNLGKIINLKLRLPAGQEVNVTGKIVRVRDLTFDLSQQAAYEVGIEFQNMSTEDKETLERFILEDLSRP